MTDKPVLNTPGELLFAARRSAGLGLEQVAENTKIPIQILGHLERDEYHRVSGPLYVNSFLRTYATEVGLEPSLVLEAYARFSGERIGPAEAPGGETVWAEEEVQIKRVGLPWLQIGLASAGGLVLILAAVWFFGLRGRAAPDDPAGPVAAAPTREQDDLPAGAANAGLAGVDSAAVETPSETAEHRERETDAVVDPGSAPPSGTPAGKLPDADEGLPTLNFADGNRWPLVLRIVSAAPVGIEVVRDSDREATPAGWGADPASLPPPPTVGVEHGQPYRVREGYVAYWGARDQFSLRLDSTQEVEVRLNGELRDLSGLQPGQELILFLPADRR